MSALPPLDVDEFADSFHAVHGHQPFPWQRRLAREVATSGWPELLDLPTGTGKTAVLDVALFALALDAGNAHRASPLRVVYVVDRRTVVDQAYERATRILKALEVGEHDVIRRIRDRLAHFTGSHKPLMTALLRGGIARDDAWAKAPDQPLVAVSTVDQVGSRLLFRGYGISDSMRPVHAGLLGSDVLYLLDEVHLSQPFRETLAAIGGRYRAWAEEPVRGLFRVVEMSATPSRSVDAAFTLDDVDRKHTVLASRLNAAKPATLVLSGAGTFLKDIQKRTLAMLDRPGIAVAVVVNRVNSARELYASLSVAVPPATSVHLLTGRMRPADRDRLEQDLFTRIRAGRVRDTALPPLVVVSTQSIEAGADFDFDALVTECASLDALRQRFGRLDRLGELGGLARGVIVTKADTMQGDPVYGDAIGHTHEWLQRLAVDARVDFGISALAVPGDAEARGLLAPKSHAPVLLPCHLDAWVQTSPPPLADPDVALWLHGPERGVADVQVVWRAGLTPELLSQAREGAPSAEAAAAVVTAMVDVLPPMSGEAMSVPFVAARRWIQGKSASPVFDVEGAAESDEEPMQNATLPAERSVLIWQGDESRVVGADQFRPGQTLVVPLSYGGITSGTWSPSSNAPIVDIAEEVAWRQRRRPTLRLMPDVVSSLLGGHPPPRPPTDDAETVDDRSVVAAWLQSVDIANVAQEASDLVTWLRADRRLRVLRVPVSADDADGEFYVVVGRSRPDTSGDSGGAGSTEGSVSPFNGVEVILANHLAGVSSQAEAFGRRVGLVPDRLVDLRLAGRWHDAGKADRRFQRWLYGGSEFKTLTQAEPLAKSTVRFAGPTAARTARERAGYPAGGRHELTSLALMEAAGTQASAGAPDWDLVRYLVAAHHGHCRPLAPWSPDPDPVDVTVSVDGVSSTVSSDHGYHVLDSAVADRFWRMVRRYGWWELAWLEAMLRLADHTQSQIEEREKGDAAHD